MSSDAAFGRSEPHLSKYGNAAETPEKPHLAAAPYRGAAMRHGDAADDEGENPSASPPLRARPREAVTKSEETIERVLTAVSEGTPLAKVLREPGMPHQSSWYDWVNADPALDQRFEQARQAGHDLISARIQDIIRGGEGSSGDIKRDRLIAEYDLKLLEKWDRRYSQRQVLAGDPETPLIPPAELADPFAMAQTLAGLFKVAEARKQAADQVKRLKSPDASDLA